MWLLFPERFPNVSHSKFLLFSIFLAKEIEFFSKRIEATPVPDQTSAEDALFQREERDRRGSVCCMNLHVAVLGGCLV